MTLTSDPFTQLARPLGWGSPDMTMQSAPPASHRQRTATVPVIAAAEKDGSASTAMIAPGGLELTDSWIDIPGERQRAVLVAAARGLHRRAAEFASATEAVAALGIDLESYGCYDRITSEATLNPAVELQEEEAFGAIAAGADEDTFLVFWDTRGGRRSVFEIRFDGAGGYHRHWLVDNGARGYCSCM